VLSLATFNMIASDDKISVPDVTELRRLGLTYESLPEHLRSELDPVDWDSRLPDQDEVLKTFPTEAEVVFSLEQWYHANDSASGELLNGAKPLHLEVAYEVTAALWLHDQRSAIPGIDAIVRAVWALIPHNIRTKIRQWAINATAEDQANIARTITSYVATVLKNFGVPAIVVRTLLGPIVRLAVAWIIKNIRTLPE